MSFNASAADAGVKIMMMIDKDANSVMCFLCAFSVDLKACQ